MLIFSASNSNSGPGRAIDCACGWVLVVLVVVEGILDLEDLGLSVLRVGEMK